MNPKKIVVAGDVCLDVLGIAIPPKSSPTKAEDNWRQTGETRTHYRLGGTFLLAKFIREATTGCTVIEPEIVQPQALAQRKPKTRLSPQKFIKLADRFTRTEIVHSLLKLDHFRAKPGDKDKNIIRVKQSEGFTGPSDTSQDPTATVVSPDDLDADMVVLDDTGNRFRRTQNQWPKIIVNPGAAKPLVIHKLHRPLPGSNPVSALWQRLSQKNAPDRIVVISVDDLRDADADISCGLSWERTALDLVWQLLNVPKFAALRDCPHLIVRLGLDGAVYWRHTPAAKDNQYQAWLIYQPAGIEGATEQSCEGIMVAYGSVFTAALVRHLAGKSRKKVLSSARGISSEIESGITAGLLATHRLLQSGFGAEPKTGEINPEYPGADLFKARDERETAFACQPVPVIEGAATPDRGYWRLLDAIFSGKTQWLHRAVALTAAKIEKPVSDEDKAAKQLLDQVPVAVFAKALSTYDRREIENYRALYSLMHDYIRQPTAPRPLSVAVFGPPGAGKSFGVKKVAEALMEAGSSRKTETLTFNLSQYQNPDELAAAFHLVRDIVLRGKIPLVFFDEFDAALNGQPLGWLRYFLAPMQDAEFLDRGTPHPIGQSIFVFAGGTRNTYAEFAKPFNDMNELGEKSDAAKKPPGDPALLERGKQATKLFEEFKNVKGPDFLSRLRGSLDIPGLDLNPKFDAYGPTSAFPCEAAILLRRAGILAFQVAEKAPHLVNADKSLNISAPVIRALLHLPKFEHGNRSFEALFDMSHLVGETKFTPSLLPASGHTGLHANAAHLGQLLATDYPFTKDEREDIAKAIHAQFLEDNSEDVKCDPNNRSYRLWAALDEDLKASNREQADDIARKLRSGGLWFRKPLPSGAIGLAEIPASLVESLARLEHDRWVAEKRRDQWIYGPAKNKALRTHPCLVKWEDTRLTPKEKAKDINSVKNIPDFLKAGGYEIYDVTEDHRVTV